MWRKILYRWSSRTVRKNGWFSKTNDAGNCSIGLFKGGIKNDGVKRYKPVAILWRVAAQAAIAEME